MSGVLLATHGSPAARHAATVAADVAVARDLELTIAHVLPPIEYRLARTAPPLPIARRLDDPFGDQVLLDARRLAWERGARVHLALLAGLPAPLIAAWARHERHGLIVIGASAHRWPARFAAPTRHRLARHSPCPVLVVELPRPDRARRRGRARPTSSTTARPAGHLQAVRRGPGGLVAPRVLRALEADPT